MLNKRVGATLLPLIGWLLGQSGAFRLAREKNLTELLLEVMERLRYGILGYAEPMPLLLAELEREQRLVGEGYSPLSTDEDFSQRWRHFVAALPVCPEGRECVEELGRSLIVGAEPERALNLCSERLERIREELDRKRRDYGRLFPALGGCAGALLAILLL